MNGNIQINASLGGLAFKGSIQRIEKFTLNMLFYTSEQKLKPAPVNLNGILDKIVEEHTVSAREQGVNLRVELDDRMESLPLDRAAISQAILNLVSNAIDACIESEEGDLVTVRSHDRGEDLLVTVEDNGTGMGVETARRVFDRFYTTKPSKGTGLGLPVAKKIIEAHGGKIEVRSALGTGTTFYVQLPKDSSRSE